MLPDGEGPTIRPAKGEQIHELRSKHFWGVQSRKMTCVRGGREPNGAGKKHPRIKAIVTAGRSLIFFTVTVMPHSILDDYSPHV